MTLFLATRLLDTKCSVKLSHQLTKALRWGLTVKTVGFPSLELYISLLFGQG